MNIVPSKVKETDLYEPVKGWLEERGYEVYPEVTFGYGANRADIVAIHDKKIITVVEMKTALSLELIAQAVAWKGYAHYRYVAVPKPQDFNWYALNLLEREGIGLITVNFKGYGITVDPQSSAYHATRYPQPQLDRRINTKFLDSVSPLHQTIGIEGGHNGGGYLTPYKKTIMGVREYLERRLGRWSTMDDILKHCGTHYSTPKPSLSKALREFETEWCECQVIDRKLHFRYKIK